MREPVPPNPLDYDENSQRELNRYTLTGQWDSLFVAILIERLHQDRLPLDQIEEQFRAHMNRGVIILFQRVKNLGDVTRLSVDINQQIFGITEEMIL